MKISITIGQKADGTYKVLYLGEDASQAAAVQQEACEKPGDFIAIAAFRKPVPFKRRRFENEEANARRVEADLVEKERQEREHREAVAKRDAEVKLKNGREKTQKAQKAEASKKPAKGEAPK